MVKSDSEKKEQGKPATESQLDLIGELCDEQGIAIDARHNWLSCSTREQASKAIHELKEMKVRDRALRSTNANLIP